MNSWDVTLFIGPDEKYASLSDALDHIPEEAYRVLVLISRDLTQDIDLFIPGDRGIQYLKISSSDNNSKTIDFLGCSFFANGIPLEIDSSITMKDCFLFGGCQAADGKPAVIPSSEIIINGAADYVYGGGCAVGSGSISTVHDVSLIIDGLVSYLYGGGYAVQSGTVHSGRIHIQIDQNGTIDRIVNGGNCLVGPDCHSIIRKIDIDISGKVTGNISLGGYAAYNSSTSIHDEINIHTENAKLSGAIYDGIKLDEKSSITIRKITGSISSEQQQLLELPDHKIQIIQPETSSETIETQNSQYSNDGDGGGHASVPSIHDTSGTEPEEAEKTEITSNKVSSEHDDLPPDPDSADNMDGEIQLSSDKEEPEESMSAAAADTQTEDLDKSPDNIPSDDKPPAGDTNPDDSSEMVPPSDDEEIKSTPDQTSPDIVPSEDKPEGKTEIIPDQIPSAGNHPQTDTETVTHFPENNNHVQKEDHHPGREKNSTYKPVSDVPQQAEKTGRKRLFCIIGILFILAALMIVYLLFIRNKTNNQSTQTEYISAETTGTIGNTGITQIPTGQNAPEEELPDSSANPVSTAVLTLSSADNKDNPESLIIFFQPTPTETVATETVFTPSAIVSVSANTPVHVIASVIPSSATNPILINVINSPTVTEEAITQAETSAAAPAASDTPVIPSPTPLPAYTKAVSFDTPTAPVITTMPTAAAAVTPTVIPSETSTPYQSGPHDETYQNEDVIVITEETPRHASIYSSAYSGTYFYQRPYQSQEYVLRWLNNGTSVEILDGPTKRNDAEWYEVSCEQYGQTGWIISSAVMFDAD